MNEKLTPEFASTVDLPLNPFARHRQVMEMVRDPEIVGDIRIEFNPRGPVAVSTDETTIIAHRVPGILGRRALKSLAKAIEVINKMDNEGEIE